MRSQFIVEDNYYTVVLQNKGNDDEEHRHLIVMKPRNRENRELMLGVKFALKCDVIHFVLVNTMKTTIQMEAGPELSSKAKIVVKKT